jgi:cellulose biosynthesis protein BcsQ
MSAVFIDVLSGKGGIGKTLWQMLLAGEASRAGRRTLLIDADPERNLSNRFGVPAHSTGLGNVLEDAGVTAGEGDAERGAKRVEGEILQTPWEHVDLLPAGASLTGIGQMTIGDHWLLHDIMDEAKVGDRYDVVLIDTGGRVGSLVTQTMYLADVAYAPVSPTSDAVRKAIEARTRVERIQQAHPLRWAGIVLTGFQRTAIQDEIRDQVLASFGEQVRAELPRRTAIDEVRELAERLGDRRDVQSANLARVVGQFLERDLLQLPGLPDGILR